jgi:hypothetical protein
MALQTGLLERTRIVSNILMLVLVCGNIFFSIQYSEALKREASAPADKTDIKIQTSNFLREFIKVVLNTQGTITFDERVKLENDIRQIQDPELTKKWDTFVNSKDSKAAQENAVKLMTLLADKMVI